MDESQPSLQRKVSGIARGNIEPLEPSQTIKISESDLQQLGIQEEDWVAVGTSNFKKLYQTRTYLSDKGNLISLPANDRLRFEWGKEEVSVQPFYGGEAGKVTLEPNLTSDITEELVSEWLQGFLVAPDMVLEKVHCVGPESHLGFDVEPVEKHRDIDFSVESVFPEMSCRIGESTEFELLGCSHLDYTEMS